MNVILIPAYRPDEELLKLIEKLSEQQLSMLIVDDGSGVEYKHIFEEASDKATVIHNCENMGKGRALKVGMQKIKEVFPECTHFITVDADGQHRVEDILRVNEALNQGASMVLTMRDFKGEIPSKSKFGNGLSRVVYTLLAGKYWSDNQSGLRGFSVNHIPWLLNVPGEKYEYEINVIYYADMQCVPITTVTIESVYINGNQASHFNPIKDTFRLYKYLFTSGIGRIVGSVLCELLVIAAYILWENQYWWFTMMAAGTAGAVCCLLIELFSFRQFKHKKRIGNFGCALFRSALYTLGAGGIITLLPKFPILAAFNICVLIMLPVRYYVHRLKFVRSRRREA